MFDLGKLGDMAKMADQAKKMQQEQQKVQNRQIQLLEEISAKLDRLIRIAENQS